MWKNRFFKSFSDSEQKSLNDYTKNNRRIVKTTFNVFRRTILGRLSGMKKLRSSFLVVERTYWTFGLNFLTFFFKTAAYVCSWRFRGFSGEKSICLIVFGCWAKVTVFWQKNLWQVAEKEFNVSPAKLWEKNDWSKLYYYHFSRTLNELFLILTKKVIRCVEKVI